MAFSFSSTAGTSGTTSITVSATEHTGTTTIRRNYTLANEHDSVLMPISQRGAVVVEKYIELIPTGFTFGPKGGNGSIEIRSNDKWTLSSNGWIDLSTTYLNARTEEIARRGPVEDKPNILSGSGNTLVGIRVGSNIGDTRTGGITGKCSSNGTISAVTSVSQSGDYVPPFIKLSEDVAKIDVTGSTGYNITVQSNIDWYLKAETGKWVHLNSESGSGNGSFSFTVDENSDKLERTDAILVYNDEYKISLKISVVQDGIPYVNPTLSISPTYHLSPSTGDSFTINVYSNTSWLVSLNVDWVKLDILNGEGNATVHVDVSAAPKSTRQGYIVFSTKEGNLKAQCEVNQEMPVFVPDLTITPYEFWADAKDDREFTIYVDSNVDWVDWNSAMWVHPDTLSGSNVGSINFTVDENTSLTARQSFLYVTASSYSLATGARIHQAAADGYIELGPDAQYIPNSGGSYEIRVESNISWTADTTESWIHLDTRGGTGDGTITVTVDARLFESEAAREAQVLIYNNSYGITAKHRVVQGNFGTA